MSNVKVSFEQHKTRNILLRVAIIFMSIVNHVKRCCAFGTNNDKGYVITVNLMYLTQVRYFELWRQDYIVLITFFNCPNILKGYNSATLVHILYLKSSNQVTLDYYAHTIFTGHLRSLCVYICKRSPPSLRIGYIDIN